VATQTREYADAHRVIEDVGIRDSACVEPGQLLPGAPAGHDERLLPPGPVGVLHRRQRCQLPLLHRGSLCAQLTRHRHLLHAAAAEAPRADALSANKQRRPRPQIRTHARTQRSIASAAILPHLEAARATTAAETSSAAATARYRRKLCRGSSAPGTT